MLFPESDASLLRAWIIKRLANTSDADADVLADYVLALLRHDGDVETIRKIFEEEIPDFLREDAAAFTDDVFQAIMYQSYRPGAPPAPPSNRHALPLPHPPAEIPIPSQYQPQLPYGAPQITPPFGQGGSRKRAYNDRDDNDVDIILNDHGSYTGAPSYKHARRGGNFARRGGRFDDPYAPRDQPAFPGPYPTPSSSGRYGPPPPAPYQPPHHGQGLRLVDPAVIMQQLGISIPQISELPKPIYSGPSPAPRRNRRRCRDYDTKGYCARGNSCRFEHGIEPPITSSLGPPASDEYDPSNVFSMLPMPTPPQNQPFQHVNMSPMPPFPMAPPTNRREPKGPRRTKGRPAIASNGSTNDRTKTTIVVQNIPQDHFTEEEVRRYFSEFGNITEVTMQDHDGLAIVKFESWNAAHAAWSSPKVIFDNRFVKVFWYKDDADSRAPLANGKNGHDAMNGTPNGRATADSASAEPFDMDEFMRKQEEVQKAHEDKTKKRQELERQRQELEDRQKELITRQLEEKRKLQAKIAEKSAKNTPEPSTETQAIEGNGKKPTSQTEALRAQLAALEEEANVLGIDPNAAHDDSSFGIRGRGRGTRSFRARGRYPPRAIRGGYGYRGRGGGIEARHAAYAAFSLDNRPKIIALSGVDFTNAEKDEALRQYLFGIGEFQEIHTEPSSTHITFKDRKTAEQFMFGISANNTIPGLDDKVEIAWASSAPQSSARTAADGDVTMTSGIEGEQAARDKAGGGEEGNVAAVNDLEEGEVDHAHHGRDQGDMDFEAGEDWGIP
ncbi:hypothetical protein GGR53DRAFT_508469 [Hypoxylon sp. FL1150]|nr:hypothetical protein GGR53DRAFT_508469 [Hypoxylon sp. FL1150]